LNINGAIGLEHLQPLVRFDETINATSTVALFQQLEEANPQAQKIHVICDNTGYYPSKEIKHYLESSKIGSLFLPPYSPNLQLIERFWKFFKRQILYNRCTAPSTNSRRLMKAFSAMQAAMPANCVRY
jgi:transposase